MPNQQAESVQASARKLRAASGKRFQVMAFTLEFGALDWMRSELLLPVPSTSILGWPWLGSYPGCVDPSMATVLAMEFGAVSRWIVCTPGPGMLNAMRCGPAVRFTWSMAQRSDPIPESFVLMTVKVAAKSAEGVASESAAASAQRTRFMGDSRSRRRPGAYTGREKRERNRAAAGLRAAARSERNVYGRLTTEHREPLWCLRGARAAGRADQLAVGGGQLPAVPIQEMELGDVGRAAKEILTVHADLFTRNHRHVSLRARVRGDPVRAPVVVGGRSRRARSTEGRDVETHRGAQGEWSRRGRHVGGTGRRDHEALAGLALGRHGRSGVRDRGPASQKNRHQQCGRKRAASTTKRHDELLSDGDAACHEAKAWATASGGNQAHCDRDGGTVPSRSDCNAREKPRAPVQKRKERWDSVFPRRRTLARLGRRDGSAIAVPVKRSEFVGIGECVFVFSATCASRRGGGIAPADCLPPGVGTRDPSGCRRWARDRARARRGRGPRWGR